MKKIDPAQWLAVSQALDQLLSEPQSQHDVIIAGLDLGAAEVALLRELLAADSAGDSVLDQPAYVLLDEDDAIAEIPADLTGRRFGAYEVVEEIGRGGMGAVLRARRADGEFEKDVAIKLIRPGAYTEATKDRFRLEMRTLATLEHPNIAHLLDGGISDDAIPYFIMELVEGAPITEYCDAAAMGVSQRLKLFQQVCDGIAYAHSQLIVHGDLKPSNILVSEEGQVKLVDFGIARNLAEKAVHELPRVTPQYSAPEQFSSPIADTRADVFGLCGTLYHLLCGNPPRQNPLAEITLASARLAGAGSEAERIAEHRGISSTGLQNALRGELDMLLARGLKLDPAQRLPSAESLRQEIDRLLNHQPLESMPGTTAYRLRKVVQRHRTGVLLGSVGLSLIVIASVTALWQAQEAREQATRSATAQTILSDVFEKADPFTGQGANVTLADALARAQPEIAARVADDPYLAWEVHHALGKIYGSLGLVEKEIAAYQSMIAAAQSLGEGRGRIYLVGVAGVGSALARTNPVEAITHFERYLPSQPDSDDDLEAWLDAQYSFVGALNRVREYERADAGTIAMQSVMEQFNVVDPRKRSRLSQLLASAARRAGDLDAEDRHWQETVNYMRQTDNPSALAVVLSNWAIHLGRQRRYEESEVAFQESLSIFEDAGLQDPTFASVLRGYAGLLFRMEHVEEAIAMTERSLDLLAPTTQFYARFVGELNLVQYAFVQGDIEKSLAVMTKSLPAAGEAFADDPAVPRRMLYSFAKLLIFGHQPEMAAAALGGDLLACSTDAVLLASLESLAHPSDQSARASLWAKIEGLTEKRLSQADLDALGNTYKADRPLFFDAMDQWVFYERIRTMAGSLSIPQEFQNQLEALSVKREKASELITKTHSGVIRELTRYFAETTSQDLACQ